jgi:hypothetical protein
MDITGLFLNAAIAASRSIQYCFSTSGVSRSGPIGDQAAASDVGSSVIDRWQFVPGRKRGDQIAMNERQRAPRHYQAAIRGAREGRDSALELAGVAGTVRETQTTTSTSLLRLFLDPAARDVWRTRLSAWPRSLRSAVNDYEACRRSSRASHF